MADPTYDRDTLVDVPMPAAPRRKRRSVQGEPFGRYTLVKRLATGGMGEIFLALQGAGRGFSRLVAIKRILSHYQENDAHVSMFFDEAKLQALLSDRHIAQIYDMGEIDDHLYIAMEYVHGVSLRRLLTKLEERGERLPPAYAADIAIQVCRGLSYAHNVSDSYGKPLSVVHRDINPQNILLSFDGEVKIIDFGIAKSELNAVNTETGTIKGKFAYMSPEQALGEKLDRRSDIFTFGVCLHELLTGESPYRRDNVVLSVSAIRHEPLPALSEVRPDAAMFQGVLARATAKNRDERYGDCAEMADDLGRMYLERKIPEPPRPIAEWLKDVFSEEMAAHRKLLRAMGSQVGLALRADPMISAPHLKASSAGQVSGPTPTAPVVVDDLDGFDEATVDGSEWAGDDGSSARVQVLSQSSQDLMSTLPPAGTARARSFFIGTAGGSLLGVALLVTGTLALPASTTPKPSTSTSAAGEADPPEPDEPAPVTAQTTVPVAATKPPAKPKVPPPGVEAEAKDPDPVDTPPPDEVAQPEATPPNTDPPDEVRVATVDGEPPADSNDPSNPEATAGGDTENGPGDVEVEQAEQNPTPADDENTGTVDESDPGVKPEEPAEVGRDRGGRKKKKAARADRATVATLNVEVAAPYKVSGRGVSGKRPAHVALAEGRGRPVVISGDTFKITLTPTAEAGGSITLSINSSPWGIVSVNNIGKGRTPTELTLSPGRPQVVVLKNPKDGEIRLRLSAD